MIIVSCKSNSACFSNKAAKPMHTNTLWGRRRRNLQVSF